MALSVAIIGSSAEVAEAYPACKVTLISSSSRLLERMDEKASAYALAWLQRRGVDVALGERVAGARPGGCREPSPVCLHGLLG